MIRGDIVLARIFFTCIVAGMFTISAYAFAAESTTALAIHTNQFEPKQLTIPAGIKMKIVIRNQDGIPAEFESYDLSREVVVPGHGEVTIYVGPLEPGTYQFFNDFNHDMQGSIVVNPAANKGN
jgi:plastocyanin